MGIVGYRPKADINRCSNYPSKSMESGSHCAPPTRHQSNFAPAAGHQPNVAATPARHKLNFEFVAGHQSNLASATTGHQLVVAGRSDDVIIHPKQLPQQLLSFPRPIPAAPPSRSLPETPSPRPSLPPPPPPPHSRSHLSTPMNRSLGSNEQQQIQQVHSKTAHAKASVMEQYESLGLVGEGSYGMVLKCRHRETGQLVAIKKFIESEDDKMVKKIAMREIRMLKQLRHDNLVNLIEVFRRKKRLYLVFEFVDHTVLDDLDRCPRGLDEDTVRRISFQVMRGTEFCHLHNIIHRDIKPENILVSKLGVVKMCDFGFARTLAKPGEVYTDYVATRWYRAPELLVGDTNYGRAVDIWAIGCLMAELLTGEPLFPGESDIDQLFHIIRCCGNLTTRHQEIFHKNPLFERLRLPVVRDVEPLEKRFSGLSSVVIDFMKRCLRLDACDRPTCSHLLKHDFFTLDQFSQKFGRELQTIVQKESRSNPLLNRSRRGAGRVETSDRRVTSKAGEQTSRADVADAENNEKPDDDKMSRDKPKRRLPDLEKISIRSPAGVATINGLSNGTESPSSTSLVKLTPQKQHLSNEETTQTADEPTHNLSEANGNHPPLNKVSEKSKTHTKKANHNHNGSNKPSNHPHRCLAISQADRLPPGNNKAMVKKHGNLTTLNGNLATLNGNMATLNGNMATSEKHDEPFHLPNVKSNEAASPARMSYKMNLSQTPCMPQIANIEVSSELNSTFVKSSTPDLQCTNFPSVV